MKKKYTHINTPSHSNEFSYHGITIAFAEINPDTDSRQKLNKSDKKYS